MYQVKPKTFFCISTKELPGVCYRQVVKLGYGGMGIAQHQSKK